MEKEFVPYEPSLVLKELGFNEPCFGYYPNNEFQFFADVRSCNTNSEFGFYPTAPTYSQTFRWFREKYGYYYPIHRTTNNTNQVLYSIGPYAGDYFTYEEAELACLIKLIEIVKNK
jgi:hypothetical protein